MTMTPYTCDEFAEHLADRLEGDADAATRAAMDAHAAGCADCAALVADLAAIRSAAASLPSLAPSRDLWSAIAKRIETPVVEFGGRRSAVGGRRWWTHPALLAAGLVGITAGVTYYATREAYEGGAAPRQVIAAAPDSIDSRTAVGAPRQVADARAADAAPASSEAGRRTPTSIAEPRTSNLDPRAPSVSAPVRLVSAPVTRPPTPDARYRAGDLAALDSLYHREILRLRTILGERRTQLDSTTVSVLERNMTIIDRAIAECRKALAADPASRFLNQQLNEALESKIELLRTAATMPVGS